MRIAMFNLRYSPNLGDGMLSECLEYGLQQAQPDISVVTLDLGGRRDYTADSAWRVSALAVLQRLPRPWRQRIARMLLGQLLRRIRPYWRAELAKVDGVVLGGGNLFADLDLNFPLKVAAAMDDAARAHLPTTVHAVGVSDNWSADGQALFRDGLRAVRLVHASVRDERSREIWLRRLADVAVNPRVVHDPGLLAAERYGAATRQRTGGPRVGIGLTHPIALRYHADEAMPGGRALTRWLAALVQGFTARGCSVFLFTNGSPEDEAYLEETAPLLLGAAAAPGSVSRLPQFARPAELAGFIATLDLLAAHRLHACVAAYSFGVAHIGFSWDVKVRSFFDSVGRARFVCEAVNTPIDAVFNLADEAMILGIDNTERLSILAETRREIATLAHQLRAATAVDATCETLPA